MSTIKQRIGVSRQRVHQLRKDRAALIGKLSELEEFLRRERRTHAAVWVKEAIALLSADGERMRSTPTRCTQDDAVLSPPPSLRTPVEAG